MSEAIPLPRAALVDTVGLRIQEMHAAGQLAGAQPLLRIDNREQARQAPFQFDAAGGKLHRTGCGAIPPASRSALYGVWEIGVEDPTLACPRCKPLGDLDPAKAARPEPRPEAAKETGGRAGDEHAVDLLYGLLSIVSQFGGVLRERGQEYRRSRAGAVLGARIEKIYADVNGRERRVLDVLTSSLDTLAVALREIDGGLNGEPTARPGPAADRQDQAR
jgi:hypothetical protein